MRSAGLFGIFLLAAGIGLAAPARAGGNRDVWFDPQRGCGLDSFRSRRVDDLPGCSGVLPPGAPEVERVLRTAKRRLIEANARLDAGSTEGVRELVGGAAEAIGRSPRAAHPDLPGRWSEALPRYREAIARIEGRLVLAPLLPGLVVAHRVAVGAAAGATAHERDGGAAEAARLARACLAAFAAARAAGASSDETIDAGDGRIRRIDDLEAECRSAALTAAPLAEAVTRSIAAHREEWRRMLTGDRRRVFDEHPGALPEFPGPFAPRAARRARQWRYSSGGAAEVFTFRGDRLVESRKER